MFDDKIIMKNIRDIIQQNSEEDFNPPSKQFYKLLKDTLTEINSDNIFFKIERLIVIGELKLDISFTGGLNIIAALNLKGKTSILLLIRYALTNDISHRAKLKDDSELLLNNITEIRLQFSINEVNYSIIRPLLPRTKGELYDKVLTDITDKETPLLMGNEISIFMLNKLGWKNFNKGNVNSSSGYNNYGLKSFYRVLYHDQKKGDIEFIEANRIERISMLSAIFKNKDFMLYSLLERIRHKIGQEITSIKKNQNEYKIKLDTEKRKLDKILSEENDDNPETYMEKISVNILNTDEQISKLKVKKMKYTINLDSEQYKKTVGEKYRIEELINRLLTREKKLITEIDNIQNKIRVQEKEADYNMILTIYEPLMCPHCEQELNDERKNLEISEGKCRLCNRSTELTNRKKDKEKIIKYYNQEKESNNKQLIKVQNELTDYISQLNIINEQVEAFDLSFSKQTELNQINNEIIFKMDEINNNSRKLEILSNNSTEQFNELLEEAQKKIDLLKTLKVQTNSLMKFIHEVSTENITQIKNEILDIIVDIHQCSFPTIELGLEINSNFELINNGEISASTPGLAHRLNLLYHFALLILGSKGIINYPNFLIVDTPGKHEIPENEMRNFFNILLEYVSKYKNCQMILSTAYNLDFPEGTHVIFGKYMNEYLFKK